VRLLAELHICYSKLQEDANWALEKKMCVQTGWPATQSIAEMRSDN
jgi:hypothetical protein